MPIVLNNKHPLFNGPLYRGNTCPAYHLMDTCIILGQRIFLLFAVAFRNLKPFNQWRNCYSNFLLGNISISGGNISLEVSGGNGTYTNTTGDLDSYSATCISTDANINISGGTIRMIVKGDQAKGFKSNGSTFITGGNITGTLSGNAAVINDNPSYCTLIKSDMDFTISDGTIIATHTGVGGKGISADGTLTINGGIIDITTSGKSETYTSSTGTGTYKSTCVTSDGKLIIKNGYVKAVSATNYAIGSNTSREISGGITLA